MWQVKNNKKGEIVTTIVSQLCTSQPITLWQRKKIEKTREQRKINSNEFLMVFVSLVFETRNFSIATFGIFAQHSTGSQTHIPSNGISQQVPQKTVVTTKNAKFLARSHFPFPKQPKQSKIQWNFRIKHNVPNKLDEFSCVSMNQTESMTYKNLLSIK